MFDEHDARRRRRPNLEGFGDAFAGRGESINTAIGALPAAAARHHAGGAEPVAPEHAPRAASSTTLGRRRAIVAPAAETQASLFAQPRHDDGARCDEVARPVHPGLDHRGPRRRSTRRSATFPQPAPVPAPTPRACSASCARASRALRTAAPALADALERRHADAAQDAAAQPPPRVAAAGAADVLRRPAGAARHPGDRPRLVEVAATRRCDYLAPAQTVSATTSRCGSATSPRCSARATATAPGSASSSSPRRRARTTRAARPRRPPTARRVDNHLHTNPYPNTASPGQPKECEAGNEPYLRRAQTVIGNVPGTQQATHGGRRRRWPRWPRRRRSRAARSPASG